MNAAIFKTGFNMFWLESGYSYGSYSEVWFWRGSMSASESRRCDNSRCIVNYETLHRPLSLSNSKSGPHFASRSTNGDL